MTLSQQDQDRIEDISRSLDSLVNRNGGMWKSLAQGRFLLNAIESMSGVNTLAPNSSITAATPVSCSKMLVLSKRTSYINTEFWVHYIVDEGGVIVKGTHDVNVAGTTATAKRITFQRPSKCTPVVDFFPKGVVKITPQNKRLIRELKGIPTPSSFVTSMIKVLERGQMLSANQLQAVQRTLLAVKYGQWEDLPSAKELRDKARALGVTLPNTLNFNKSADKRTALAILESAEKRAKVKAVKRAFETLGGTDGCYMSRQNLVATHHHLKDILQHLEANPCVEDWAESKISQAHAILQSVAEYFKYGKG